MPNIPLPRVVLDVIDALQASTPHAQAANAKQDKIIALLREVENEHSGLSPEEQATRRREIDELSGQVRSETDAACAPLDALKARHPRWIK